MAEAVEQGSDMVMTLGTTQTNHGRQTAASATKMGLKCHILLEDRTDYKDGDYYTNCNVLHDPPHGATNKTMPAGRDMPGKIEKAAEKMHAQGHTVFVIPGDGSNLTGSSGYVNAALEPVEQANRKSLKIGPMANAPDPSGTQVGLVTDMCAMTAQNPILGIGIHAPQRKQELMVNDLACKTAEKLGCPSVIKRKDMMADADFIGEGSSIPTQRGIEAIKMFAELEGIPVDPYNSTKGAVRLTDLARKGHFKDERVVFQHTVHAAALGGYDFAFGHSDHWVNL